MNSNGARPRWISFDRHRTAKVDSPIRLCRLFSTTLVLPPSIQRSLQHFDKFIRDCKEAGFFYRLQLIFPLIGNNLATAILGIRPTLLHKFATAVNLVEGDYSESTGLTGNGTTKYADSTWNANQLAANDCHIAVYHRADNAQSGNRILAGAADASHQYFVGSLVPASSADGRLGQTVNAGGGTSYTKGFYLINRTANNDLKLYRNNIQIGSSATVTTGVPPNHNIYLGAHNNNGAANSFLNTPISFVSVGQSLNAQQLSDYYAIVQTFQTNLGRAV